MTRLGVCPQVDLEIECLRTGPDRIVYSPDRFASATDCCSNEHFLVEELATGALIAVWTQSSYEGNPDQHIVFSKSLDRGSTWQAPLTIAQADPAAGVGMASWGFPLVSRSGRIYVLFSRHMGINDFAAHTAGRLAAIYSDDEGASWSEAAFLPVAPRSIFDHADSNVPPNVIVWQKPARIAGGKYLVGATRWSTRSPDVSSVVEFLRFENIDDDPAPKDLIVNWLTPDEQALRYGRNLQEPSIVTLPDGRLFAAMRSCSGCPCFSVSDDLGEHWTPAEPMRWRDDAEPLKQPLSPCPIYQFDSETYAFFFHNHDGGFLHHAKDSDKARRPICLAKGEFRPGAKQPIWFSEPWYFMDNGGIKLLRSGFSLYSSTTAIDDGFTLWYPDRKFFLLGRDIKRSMVQALMVPEMDGLTDGIRH